jgi:hypothetical protein
MAADGAKKASAKKATAKRAAKATTAKKAVAKKAPAKKAVAKKAAVKKIVAAPTEPAPTPDVLASAVPPLSAGPTETPEPATPLASTASTAPTVVERLVQLDWRTTVRIAGPTFLVLFAASCVLSASLLLLPDSTDGAGGFGGRGGYFHAVAMLAAMAFGSAVGGSGSSSGDFEFSLGVSSGIWPLTVTILVLAVFAALCRRYVVRGGTGQTLVAVAQASIVFAVLAMGLSFFAHTSFSDSDSKATLGASPGIVFGWALVLSFIVAVVSLFLASWLARLRQDETRAARFSSWRLPLEGGLAALATSVVLGGVVFLAIAFGDHSEGHPPSSIVARALPVIAGLFVNIGTTVTGFAMGARVGVTGAGSDVGISYFNLHDLSPAYYLLLLLPIVSIGAGVLWMLHRRQDEDDRTLSRACYRMAAPYALGWLVLAFFSRASVGAGFLGGVHVGPQLLVGFGFALAWGLVVGIAFGRLLLARGARARRPWSPHVSAPSWQRVVAFSTVVIVAMIAIDLATGGAPASARTSAHIARAVPLQPQPAPTFTAPTLRPPTLPPFAPPSGLGDVSARSALIQASFAEDRYHAQHGTYTRDESALTSFFPPPDVNLTIVRADSASYCINARAVLSGNLYSYNSATRRVEDGSC